MTDAAEDDWEWRVSSYDYEHGLKVELWITTKSKAPHLQGKRVGQDRHKQFSMPPNKRQQAHFVKKAKAELRTWATAPIPTGLP